jgi:hypothetical protein
LTSPSPVATLEVVLKRGTVPVFEGGLNSRLLLLFDILPRVVNHA